tara:strand:+ start:7938 stop:8639 length:702 start_codon:yes stop_codon:yes gene_type:complete
MIRFLILLLSISQFSSVHGIVGGELVGHTDPLSYHVVSWAYQKKSFCSGVIIGKRRILTAAHCVSGGLDEIAFGQDVNKAKFIPVVHARVHTYFTPSKMSMKLPNAMINDIAVLTLKENIPSPYKAVSIYNDLDDTGDIYLYGYGKTSVNGAMGLLHRKKVELIDYFVPSGEWVTSQAACGGDSGGPLIYTNKKEVYLLGITSRSDKRFEGQPCNGPSVQTDLRHQRWWLNGN